MDKRQILDALAIQAIRRCDFHHSDAVAVGIQPPVGHYVAHGGLLQYANHKQLSVIANPQPHGDVAHHRVRVFSRNSSHRVHLCGNADRRHNQLFQLRICTETGMERWQRRHHCRHNSVPLPSMAQPAIDKVQQQISLQHCGALSTRSDALRRIY